jgi:hypothetical protein
MLGIIIHMTENCDILLPCSLRIFSAQDGPKTNSFSFYRDIISVEFSVSSKYNIKYVRRKYIIFVTTLPSFSKTEATSVTKINYATV